MGVDVVELEILDTGIIGLCQEGGSLLDYVGYLHIFLKDARDGRVWIIWYRYGYGRGTRVGKDGVDSGVPASATSLAGGDERRKGKET